MPTQPYLIDGDRVPSVTTILGQTLSKQALVRWAFNRGRDGLDLYSSRDQAASAGTIAHELIDLHAWGRPVEVPAAMRADEETEAMGWGGYRSFVEWEETQQLEFVETEMPLISQRWRFGGTPDAVARVGREQRLCLVDWKTSNGTYLDHMFQLAGYLLLLGECRPEYQIERVHLLRFGKEDGEFHHHGWNVKKFTEPTEEYPVPLTAGFLFKRLSLAAHKRGEKLL